MPRVLPPGCRRRTPVRPGQRNTNAVGSADPDRPRQSTAVAPSSRVLQWPRVLSRQSQGEFGADADLTAYPDVAAKAANVLATLIRTDANPGDAFRSGERRE